jgi:hypothetical protein
VVKVTAQGSKRVSIAALIAARPGATGRARLIYRTHLDRVSGKHRRKGFTETDYARLLELMSALLRRIPWRARSLAGCALLVVTFLGSLVATVGPASASAGGCHFWGHVYIPIIGVDLPDGEYCFGVSGSGTTVNYTDGNYTTMWLYQATPGFTE